MMQAKNVVVAVVALVVGFGSGFVTRPIIAPTSQAAAVATSRLTMSTDAPRAVQYFAAHLDEARQVAAGCAAGSVRGNECSNAEQAIVETEGRDRFKRFMGN